MGGEEVVGLRVGIESEGDDGSEGKGSEWSEGALGE